MDRSVSETMGLHKRMNRSWIYTMSQRISRDTTKIMEVHEQRRIEILVSPYLALVSRSG